MVGPFFAIVGLTAMPIEEKVNGLMPEIDHTRKNDRWDEMKQKQKNWSIIDTDSLVITSSNDSKISVVVVNNMCK